jgi:hypothetical protein
LGALLVYLTFKSRVKGKLKVFLLILGFSSAGFLVFSVLHNFFYALAIVSENIIVLKYIFEFLHVASFLISIVGCPIGFIIGAIGGIALFLRK